MKASIVILLLLGVLFLLVGGTGLHYALGHGRLHTWLPLVSCALLALGGLLVFDCARLIAMELENEQ